MLVCWGCSVLFLSLSLSWDMTGVFFPGLFGPFSLLSFNTFSARSQKHERNLIFCLFCSIFFYVHAPLVLPSPLSFEILHIHAICCLLLHILALLVVSKRVVAISVHMSFLVICTYIPNHKHKKTKTKKSAQEHHIMAGPQTKNTTRMLSHKNDPLQPNKIDKNKTNP